MRSSRSCARPASSRWVARCAKGPTYALRAVDPAGEEVRVIVDAQRGRIVKVIPLMAPRYAMPLLRPPYGRPPRPMAMVPEGYGPNPRAPNVAAGR